MATAEIRTTIDRPVADVFAYVVAIENLREWVEVIQDAWPVSGSLPEVGATYTVKARFMGQTMEIPSEVVGYERDRLYAYRSYGSLAYVDTMTFTETEGGTLVTEQIDMTSDGRFSRLLDPLKLIISKRSHRKNQEQLKRILEGGSVAALA